MEEVTYRSKDKVFMRQLKKAVYHGADDEDEKRSTWEYISRRVVIDDLHKYAIEQLDRDEPIEMGHGDLHARLLVLTMKPIVFSKEGKELTETIVGAGKFKHVYYTAKYKTNTVYKIDIPTFETILESEIKILKPKAILCFGEVLPVGSHQIEEYMGIPVMQTHLISKVLKASDDEEVRGLKNEIWNDVKQIRKHYRK